MREYDHGALVREERVPAQRRPVGDPVAGPRAVKTRRKREVRMGETIYKGAPSYDLMLQLQLGIRWSVSRVTPEQPREIGDADFRQGSPQAAVSARFPRGGSATTPPHASHDFKWKDYCPMVRVEQLAALLQRIFPYMHVCGAQVFRKLRERFGIDAGDYMLSLCGASCSHLVPCPPSLALNLACAGDMALRELSSPGKSGSVFFLSQDGRFIVKTMRKAEMVRLCPRHGRHTGKALTPPRAAAQTLMRESVLQDYYAHVLAQPDTLLTRFFGLHRVKPHGGRNVRFVVMGNLLCTDYDVHRRYDLKGSTYGRITAQPYDPTKKILKDLDLEYTFQLDDDFATRLRQQLVADCTLLERLHIMDYSLLLGVHFKHHKAADKAADRAAPGGLLATRARMSARLSGPVGDGDDPDDDGSFDGVMNSRLGENMNAVALPGRVLAAPKGVMQPPVPSSQCEVILNFGIIDILQEYNMSKQVEHAWKVRLQAHASHVGRRSLPDA